MSIKKIEHVVHLMLENRSFDTMLGWLYQDKQPAHNIPSVAKGDEFHGLQSINLDNFTNGVVNLDISSAPIRGTMGPSVPDIHPGEEFNHVNQQLFGKVEVNVGDKPTMKGYMEDYAAMLKKANYSDKEIKANANMVMQTYTPSQLPILNQLAEHYAVCDEWFSSVPSQTNPNRAFALTGSSHGLVDNGFLEKSKIAKALGDVLGMGVGDDRFPNKTIFNVLNENGHPEWKIYWETSMIPEKISNLIDKASNLEVLLPFLPSTVSNGLTTLIKGLSPFTDYISEISSGKLSSCYSYRLYPQLHEQIDNVDSHFAKTDEFHVMARAGTLPKYSYIEPYWTISKTTVDRGLERLVTTMGNDYHPPCNLNEGENYVKAIYESLISNKESWDKTLLIITFDEPVGAFDHIKPPSATPPWGANTPDFKLQEEFNFDRFGGRVPAILVSPLIEKGTVFRSDTGVPFDHTSVIRTLLNKYDLGDKTAEFGQRAVNAPTFDHIVTRNTPRDDATSVGFMNRQRPMGSQVKYADRFRLKNQNGDYLSAFRLTGLTSALEVIPKDLQSIGFDLGLFQHFPTLGKEQSAELFFQNSKVDDREVVSHNDMVRIGSDEDRLGSYNYLGAWKDSHDCYYYNIYLRGEQAPKQQWQIQKVNNDSSSVKFGDKVYLVNQFFENQRLSHDDRLLQGKWITTKEKGDCWTIESVE